ncbi:hypothetical protein ACR3IL_09390 [Streptococcus iniae]
MLEIKNGTILKDKRILIDQITQKFENHRIYGLVGINVKRQQFSVQDL